MLDICGLGNALMDVLVRIDDDALLSELSLNRGIMHLVDGVTWMRAYDRVRDLGPEINPGGSCANTLSTAALLGARTLLCGQVADDGFGRQYAEAVTRICGDHRLHLCGTETGPTGKCLSLISPDGERTMLTNLGVAIELPEAHFFADRLGQGRMFHLTGYQFTGGGMTETAGAALEKAKAEGVPVSFDVADPFVIRFHRERIWEIIDRYAFIVFTNEEEAKSLCDAPPVEAAHELARHAEIAVVKLGARGSLVVRGDEVVEAAAHRVPVVDTTGAGDAYAGGFLFGMSRDWPLARCAALASRVAAETVAQTGAVVTSPGRLARIAEAA